MTPDACWDLVTHLPREAAVWAQMADDEDAAAHLGGASEPRPPSLAEYSPVVEALAAIHDLIGSLLAVQVARGGAKPPKIRPYPRPVTAAERARKRGRVERHQALVARLLPARKSAG